MLLNTKSPASSKPNSQIGGTESHSVVAKHVFADVDDRPAGGRARSVVTSSFVSLRDECEAFSASVSNPATATPDPRALRGSRLGRVVGAAASKILAAVSADSCASAPSGAQEQHRSSVTRSRVDAIAAAASPTPPPPSPQPADMTDEAKSYGIFAYGNAFAEEGEYDKALSCYNRALVLQRSALGVDHEMTGRTLRSIGTCLMKMGGEFSFAALTALEEALYIRQLNFGEGDSGAAEITNDIWTLLHKKRLELKGTPDREGMLREMKKQKSKRELQSFVFQSVRRRGSTWSSDSLRSILLGDSSGSLASGAPSVSSSESSFDTAVDVCSNQQKEMFPIAPREELCSTIDIDTIVGVGPCSSHSAMSTPSRRRRRNSLIGAAPAMQQIMEDSLGSSDFDHDSRHFDSEEEEVRNDRFGGEDDDASAQENYPSHADDAKDLGRRDGQDLGDGATLATANHEPLPPAGADCVNPSEVSS